MGGPEEEGGRCWEGRKGRGAERSRGRETRRVGPRRGCGGRPRPRPSPQGPGDANRWIRGRPCPAPPGWLHSAPFGAQTESKATEVGLQGRTANQRGRRREAREGLGAPFSSFAQIRSSWACWALAREVWMMGWAKASPSGRGNRELFFLTLSPHLPKIPPRRWLLPCPLRHPWQLRLGRGR